MFPGKRFVQLEPAFTQSLRTRYGKTSRRSIYILVESLEGISRNDREIVSARGTKIRVIAQFFDAALRAEGRNSVRYKLASRTCLDSVVECRSPYSQQRDDGKFLTARAFCEGPGSVLCAQPSTEWTRKPTD